MIDPRSVSLLRILTGHQSSKDRDQANGFYRHRRTAGSPPKALRKRLVEIANIVVFKISESRMLHFARGQFEKRALRHSSRSRFRINLPVNRAKAHRQPTWTLKPDSKPLNGALVCRCALSGPKPDGNKMMLGNLSDTIELGKTDCDSRSAGRRAWRAHLIFAHSTGQAS